MSVKIPTTQEITNQGIAHFEANLNQTVPANERAFTKIIAVLLALQISPLYRFGAERTLQVFALTATGDGLDLIGNNFGVVRKPAEAAVLTITLPGTDPTVVPINTDFIGALNGVRYFSNVSATTSGGIATIQITAESVGTSGNLSPGNTLTISIQIPGMETIATVTVVDNTGADRETDEAYRPRVLQIQRSKGGGGNTADYKSWSEEVAGVFRAFPYVGDPEDVSKPPPYRTVYIQSESTINSEGISPPALLDQVRDEITTNPVTGIARQTLGLTDDTLIIRSISRINLYYQITGLTVDASIEAQVKTDINTALENYSRRISPFVPGLDPQFERNDTITDVSASKIVQDVVAANGGTVQSVAFGLTSGSVLPEYTLAPGELAKSGGVTYV